MTDIRIYKLFNENFWDDCDLRDYETEIIDAYKEYAPNVKVEVFQDCYVVVGKLPSFLPRKIGRSFRDSHKFDQYYIVTKANISRLFRKVGEISVPEFILDRIYELI